MIDERAAAVLDKAIAEVAGEEFNRLSRGLDPIQRAKKIEYALRQLEGLQKGKMPEYDEWVALFYVSWYQGSQVNLAYSIIDDMLNDADYGVSIDDTLHIVDLGCGALAMQFGVAMAVADEIRQGRAITTIRIDLIDDSAPMVAIGKRIWDAFTQGLSQSPELIHISQACEKIVFQEVSATAVKKIPGDCWVSAIHAVYEENKENLKGGLSDLINRITPDIWFSTTYNDSYDKGTYLLLEVCDFCSSEYHPERMEFDRPQLSGNLEGVTQWRRDLCSSVLPSGAPLSLKREDRQFIENYLTKSPVSWKLRNVAINICTRLQ